MDNSKNHGDKMQTVGLIDTNLKFHRVSKGPGGPALTGLSVICAGHLISLGVSFPICQARQETKC